VGGQVRVRGLRLVAVEVDELLRPRLITAGDHAVLGVVVDRHEPVTLGNRRVAAPQRDYVDPAVAGGLLHEGDDRILVCQVVQYPVADDDVVQAVRSVVPHVARGDADLDAGLPGERLDLLRADRAQFHGVDLVAEQRQPDGIGALTRTDIQGPALGPVG